MPYRDLREFIARLEDTGEMRRIEEEVDWNLEAGAIARRTLEEKLPAPFFQKVKDSPEGCSHGIIVAVKNAYYGIAGEIAHTIWGSRHGCITPWVIVVEDDVDPFNMEEVWHAMMSKCHPSRGVNKLEHALAWPLFPWLSEYERKHRMGARVYFDCTWPVHWKPSEVPARMSFREAYPEDVQKKALDKLQKSGFK